MILEIKQIAASGRNQFEVSENGQLLYRATAPFYKPSIPIGGSAFRELTLSDSSRELLHTEYNAMENFAASAVPLSWLFKDAKQVRRYRVADSAGNAVGVFWYEQTGVADTKLVIEYGARLLACYRKEVGKKEVVSVYDGETQLGQITKPNCVIDNLDYYLAHFIDNSINREILSLFVVYYDFLFHNCSGEIAKGWSKNITYTFDKNNKKYNKKFIAENFGEVENERVEQFIKDAYTLRK